MRSTLDLLKLTYCREIIPKQKELRLSPSTKFKDLVKIMVDYDYNRLREKMIKLVLSMLLDIMVWSGSAIIRLKDSGYKNIITSSSSELDLRIQFDVEKFFQKHKPEYVCVHCRSKSWRNI